MKNRNLMFFMLASAFWGVSQSIDTSVFNNFLNDTFNISVTNRTLLEIPRELPGFLVVFISGLLYFFTDFRLAALSSVLAAVGMMGLGFLSNGMGITIIWMVIYSTGQHLNMPISNSIGMELAEKGNMGKVLGKINGLNTAAFLVTSLITAYAFRNVVNYKIAYFVGATALVIATVLILFMTPINTHRAIRKVVFKKEYSLFYWLSIIYGARKQIFITFGPWVLIKVFHQGVSTFATLGFITAAVGMFFKPYLGHLIDKYGEKFILSSEAVLLIFVCFGYGFSRYFFTSIGQEQLAVYFVGGFFIADQLLASSTMARSTYLKKTALSQDDVTSTLYLGITMDHVLAMTIPWIGGLIWSTFGYEYVFVGGAMIAVINFFVARKIRIAA